MLPEFVLATSSSRPWGFVPSQWSQGVEFSAGNVTGEIEVIYFEERPTKDIGPFVLEEASLINSLAEMISSALTRRYAQKALKESEEVFRTLAETVSAGIYIYRDSQFIYVNPTAEQLTGYSREELLKMSPTDLIHPDFRDAVARGSSGADSVGNLLRGMRIKS